MDIYNIFSILRNNNPTPKTELEYINHYTLLIAIILSAQSTDIMVNKATKNLFVLADTPSKMLDLGEKKLKEYIKIIGLFNTKAKNIIALSQILVDKYNSEIPNKFEDLIALPGVGRKTANVFLNCAFGNPTIGVDTHVFRVSNRIGITNAKTTKETERQLLDIIPSEFKQHAHHWLILHGRYICKSRNPLCNICCINRYCNFYNKK